MSSYIPQNRTKFTRLLDRITRFKLRSVRTPPRHSFLEYVTLHRPIAAPSRRKTTTHKVFLPADLTSPNMNNSNKHGKSKEIVEKLLGSSIICTLADGRTAEGNLVCVDRMYVFEDTQLPSRLISRRSFVLHTLVYFCTYSGATLSLRIVRRGGSLVVQITTNTTTRTEEEPTHPSQEKLREICGRRWFQVHTS